MPTTSTTRDRARLLATVLTGLGDPELRDALDRVGHRPDMPRPVANAAGALRRSRTPREALGRPPYRVVLPFLAATAAEECLAKTIETLGDDSEDPTREQLLGALESLGSTFPDPVVAVMLVSIGTDEMPASELCLEILTTDERYGVAGSETAEVGDEDTPPGDRADLHSDASSSLPVNELQRQEPAGDNRPGGATRGTSAEQRAARRERRKAVAEDRRQRQDATRRAHEELRKRRHERVPSEPHTSVESAPPAPRRTAPTLVRRPELTPTERREFDPDDVLVGSIVFLWVPFSADRDDETTGSAALDVGHDPAEPTGGDAEVDDDEPGSPDALADPVAPGEGKRRPCVVVGVSPDELLVRPGYSEGGRQSRAWTSVALRHWRQVGLEQPTWISAETIRRPRPELDGKPPRLTVDDWNALW